MPSDPQRESYIRTLIAWRGGDKATRGPKPAIDDFYSVEKMARMRATLDGFFAEATVAEAQSAEVIRASVQRARAMRMTADPTLLAQLGVFIAICNEELRSREADNAE